MAIPSNPIGYLLVVAVSVSCESGALVSMGRRAVGMGSLWLSWTQGQYGVG